MSRTKASYEEIVVAQGWDMESQIALFLKYAEEYQLTDHYLTYLATKPVASPKNIIPSSHYPLMQLVQMVIKNKEITGYINDNALVCKDSNPWSAAEIFKCIRSVFSIEIDPNDIRLVDELISYFNYRHALMLDVSTHDSVDSDLSSDNYLGKLRQSYIEKSSDDLGEKVGDSYFDVLLSRYASIGTSNI